MSPDFREAVESLHPKFEHLMATPYYVSGSLLPKQGIYVFFESGKALYVGRSNNIPNRRRQHTGIGSQINQAVLATLIAREETQRSADYRKGAHERRLADLKFMDAFKRAKDRVRAMDFRAVEECDQTRQTLLEVYCAITLKTKYNDFGTH